MIVGIATLMFSHAASVTGPVTGIANKCLDNSAAKVADGNKIQLWQCNGTVAQAWTLPGDGTIRVQGYCLDVQAAGKAPKTLVQLYHCNGTVAQQWKVDKDAKTVINPNSGMCLDDQAAGTANGNQIWIYTCNGTDAQKWNVPTLSTPKPAAPTNLKGSVVNTSVTLNWTASSSTGTANYKVLRGSQVIATLGATITTYADSNVTSGQTYTYQVQAVNSGGATSDLSNSVSVKYTAPSIPTPPSSTNNPRGKALYVSPSYANAGRPAALSSQPISEWFGDWTPTPGSAVKTLVDNAASKGQLAQLVAYNVPHRDCGSYSKGGANDAAAYKAWIRNFASGINGRAAIVTLEPDALAQMDCLGNTDQTERLSLISDAVNVLAAQGAYVYVDAGTSAWINATDMASRLNRANIAAARGFSLNVSNFQTNDSSMSYGNTVSSKVGGKPYVIDTSRNGQGPTADNQWCNPAGRGLGKKPTTTTNQTNVDAYLWIKRAGESDGNCNGGPGAGQWFESYAQMLIKNAKY
jgi:endoglucanase